MRILLAILIFSLVSCTLDRNKETYLCEAYEPYFNIGVAINKNQVQGESSKSTQLIQSHFNSVTPENELKWENIHPLKDSFNFEFADQYVEYGVDNDFKTIGHTLLWHSQLPEYVKLTKDSLQLTALVTNHISQIVSRYKGKIKAWDVINEALNEDGSFRQSVFYNILGPEYFVLAYKLVQQIDPDAKLIYNDYNLWKSEKRKGVIGLFKLLKKNGITLDEIGMQGHYSLIGPDLSQIEESILAFAKLGVKISISELDITVLPNPWDLEGADVNQNFENSAEMNPYTNELPNAVAENLADRYQTLFELFLKHHENISRITFWGLDDGSTWLNNWPIKNRTNYPLLFDRNLNPKLAVKQLLELPNTINK